MACAFTFFISCENDIEKIQSFSEQKIYPTISGKNYEILKSDSGKVRCKLVAPEIKYFEEIKDPYMEFPEGIEVYFYDSAQNESSKIKSDYAIYYNEQKLALLRNNVQVKDLNKGDILETEELFWDEGNEKIYSDKFTKITGEKQTIFAKGGFECNQDFSDKIILKKTIDSSVNIEDE